jgi:hypothetical protein
LDGFSCIAFPMFPKYCKFLVDIVDYLMWFFFLSDMNEEWYDSTVYFFLSSSRVLSILKSDACMLQVEKLLGLFEFCFCWELSLGCEIAWSHKEECECRHSLALVVDLQI